MAHGGKPCFFVCSEDDPTFHLDKRRHTLPYKRPLYRPFTSLTSKDYEAESRKQSQPRAIVRFKRASSSNQCTSAKAYKDAKMEVVGRAVERFSA